MGEYGGERKLCLAYAEVCLSCGRVVAIDCCGGLVGASGCVSGKRVRECCCSCLVVPKVLYTTAPVLLVIFKFTDAP